MRLLLHSIPATLVAVLFSALVPLLPAAIAASAEAPCSPQPAAAERYARLVTRAADEIAGQRVALEVDLAASAEFSLAADGTLRYGMLFNDVAEGWSWQPDSRPGDADYYRWKFLPLQSFSEEGAAYVQEEMIGVPQRTRVERRHDYFLAFDNPHAFYARGDDGFALRLDLAREATTPSSLRLVALARLGQPALAESTTFWKAVHARPVDFTLKKRYLIGTLEALVVCAAHGDRELARLVPAASPQR